MTRATFATAAVAVALSILALAKPRKHTPTIPPQPEPETPRWWSPSRFPGAVLSQVLAGLIVVGLLAMMHQLTMVRTSYPSAPKGLEEPRLLLLCLALDDHSPALAGVVGVRVAVTPRGNCHRRVVAASAEARGSQP